MLPKNKFVAVATIVLLALSFLILTGVYSREGIGWDFMDHYLNGRTFANIRFYQVQLPITAQRIITSGNFTSSNNVHYTYAINVTPEVYVNDGLYFSEVRNPAGALLMAVAILLYRNYAIQIYLAALLALLALGSIFAAKKLDLDPLLVVSLILSPYVIRWTVMYSSVEALSLAVALFVVGLILAGGWLSGIAMGVLGLSKYTNLVEVPLLLFAGDRRKIAKAILAFVMATLPWLLFGWLYFGNPVYSYYLSFTQNVAINTTQQVDVSLYPMLLYPILILIVYFAVVSLLVGAGKVAEWFGEMLKEIRNYKTLFSENRKVGILLGFFLLSLVGFMIVYNHVGIIERFAYLLYGSISLGAAYVIDSRIAGNINFQLFKRELSLDRAMGYLAFCVTTISLLLIYIPIWNNGYTSWLGFMYGSDSRPYPDAVSYLVSAHLSGCRVLTNAWPFLNYYNISASPANTCNATMERYPLVVFRNVGSTEYCNIHKFSLAGIPTAQNFSVYLPPNYTCYGSG